MQSREQAPNILWIMSDQHNASAWGAGGSRGVRTPNLDRLSQQGVTFPRAYCNNPICGPSRSCFLTGQYVSTHQVSGNYIYDAEVPAGRNLAREFKNAGYSTALVGKGHLPKRWMEEGFAHRRYCDLADAERDDPRSVHYFDYLVRKGLGDMFDLGKLTQDRPGSCMEAFTSEIPFEHSVENWTGNEALSFLESVDSDMPFFLQLSFQRPHDPYAPSVESSKMYDPNTLELPESASEFFEGKFTGKPQFQQHYMNDALGRGYPYRPKDESDLKTQLAHYYTLISIIDDQIGRVLTALEESGRLENTIVVYHADHGDFAGEHGLMLKNLGIYESIQRIPFIVKYPGCVAGSLDTRLVESVDLFPTLCELANLSIPEGGDGASLFKDSEDIRDCVVCEWDFPVYPQNRVFAARSETHRLVYYPEFPNDGELYDCMADPEERDNLYHCAEVAEIRFSLMAKIFNQVCNYKRVHGLEEDAAMVERDIDRMSNLIHRDGKRWSDVAGCEMAIP